MITEYTIAYRLKRLPHLRCNRIYIGGHWSGWRITNIRSHSTWLRGRMPLAEAVS